MYIDVERYPWRCSEMMQSVQWALLQSRTLQRLVVVNLQARDLLLNQCGSSNNSPIRLWGNFSLQQCAFYMYDDAAWVHQQRRIDSGRDVAVPITTRIEQTQLMQRNGQVGAWENSPVSSRCKRIWKCPFILRQYSANGMLGPTFILKGLLSLTEPVGPLAVDRKRT
jgi:hypothetical protein